MTTLMVITTISSVVMTLTGHFSMMDLLLTIVETKVA